MTTETFKIKMTCYNPDGTSYEDEVKTAFNNLEDAKKALARCVAEELETLRNGCANDREFLPNFESNEHHAVVECWFGAPGDYDEDSRDMAPVTEYDVYFHDPELNADFRCALGESDVCIECVSCGNLMRRDIAMEQTAAKGIWECPYCGALYNTVEDVGVAKSIEDLYLNILSSAN